MRLAKLFLRGFGQYEEMGNYTILYDGEGILEFGLTEQHIIHDGKGDCLINLNYFNECNGKYFTQIFIYSLLEIIIFFTICT